MDDLTRDLFIRGMLAAKAKESADARRYLEWVLRLDPPQDMRVDALYWLSKVAETPKEQRRLLEEALAYNPSEMRCRRELAVLKGDLDPGEIVDPDRFTSGAGPALTAGAKAGQAASRPAGADRFTCPQCGGRMTYAPDGQSLTCEYCAARSSAARPALAAEDDPSAAQNFLIAMATRKGHLHPVTRQTFNCQGCGSPFLLPAQQLSATCPYCGSAYVVRRPQSRG